MLEPGQVAIVGARESDRLGKQPDKSMLQLHAEAALNALQDAGLHKREVDGLFTAGPLIAQLSEYLGITPSYADGTWAGGCSFLMLVQHAAAALTAGLCNVALITHGESGASDVGVTGVLPRIPAPQSPSGQFEVPYGISMPANTWPLAATRHMAVYGTTSEQLAAVAVATRRWAALNPRAYMRTPITVEDVLASRMICYPMHLLDCCLRLDGGGALVLVRADRARDFPKPPVWLLGSGEGVGHWNISQARDLTTSDQSTQAARQAFAMSGLTHQDIDHVMMYDAFTFSVLIGLEDCGFVPRGESGPFMEDLKTAPGGRFPMNTNGGGLSYCHTGMYGMFAIQEGVRQLRQESEERQVACKTSLIHGPGGYFSAGAVLILGNQTS